MGLTKYKEGSIKELCALAFPLMLSSFSVMTMIFADRWFLAHHSSAAHNAAVTATTLGWAFIFGWVILGSVAQVFVAQYNGARLYSRLGEPVWQMIWLSLSSVIFFWPLSYLGAELFFGTGLDAIYERDYFKWMILFGPFHPLCAALCGFFIGQGKTRLVTYVVIFANIVNIILDQILIFGIEGIIPALEVKGAAIATNIATILQSIILGMIFLSKKNREQYGTLKLKLNFNALWDCIRIGFPNAVFVVVELTAFAVYYMMMKRMGIEYITITGICQTIFILFFFFCEGLNKATAALVGNLIGAGRPYLISRVIKSGIILNTLFFLFILFFFSAGSDLILSQFLPHADANFISQIRHPLQTCLIFLAVYLYLDGLRFQFTGALTAAGDTVFLFLSGTSLVWCLMVAPVYFFVVRNGGSVELGYIICIIYSVIAALIYLRRILTGNWQALAVKD